MTTDAFTEAARAVGTDPEEVRESMRNATEHAERHGMSDEDLLAWVWHAGVIYGRDHLAAQRAEEVRAWAVRQYPSGTPLDQDRRMVAAETEAYLSGRTDQEMSELAQAAKHAGPVDPPAQEARR